MLYKIATGRPYFDRKSLLEVTKLLCKECFKVDVGTQEGRYKKGRHLTTVNPIWRVTPSSIPLAKLGRAVTASTWQQTVQKYARQLIQGAR